MIYNLSFPCLPPLIMHEVSNQKWMVVKAACGDKAEQYKLILQFCLTKTALIICEEGDVTQQQQQKKKLTLCLGLIKVHLHARGTQLSR